MFNIWAYHFNIVCELQTYIAVHDHTPLKGLKIWARIIKAWKTLIKKLNLFSYVGRI